MPKSVTLRKSDYVRALTLAEQFNLNAGARPNRKVKAALKEAVAFMAQVTPAVVKGEVVETGSAWGGPDEFLSKSSAVATARQGERADYLTGTVDIQLPKRDAEALASIRRAFRLSSDKQAAGLALRVYDGIADGIRRGNGFSYANPQSKLDVDKVRDKVLPQTP
jgi:Arc/MetJ family transcription regulator